MPLVSVAVSVIAYWPAVVYGWDKAVPGVAGAGALPSPKSTV